MNEALLGVIIGGVIASILPIIIFFDSRSKWEKEKKMARLEQKKELYKNQFEKASQELLRLLEEKRTGADIFFFDISLPEEVRKEYQKLLDERKSNPESIKSNYFRLDISMKKYIKTIDDEIDKLINLKNIS